MLADRLEEGSGCGDGILFRAAAKGLGDKPCQVAFEQGAVDTVAEGVGLGADSVRNVENRVRPAMSDCTVAGLRPELSRSRAQRLARVLSHGWAIRSNRRWVRACGVCRASGQAGQPMQAPDVAGILDLPPDAFVQGFDDIVGEDQKPLVVALFRSGKLTPLLCGAGRAARSPRRRWPCGSPTSRPAPR